jgi:hypothetical protein
MDKAESRLGYQTERTQACRQLLITLFRKLGPWREKLILVGGLVPYLLFEDGDHVGTTDTDLVLNPSILRTSKAIALSSRISRR